MKTKSIFFLLLAFIYLGCSGDDDISVPVEEFRSSLFVTVKDPDGFPVKGASITIDDLTGTTDDNGTFFFTQIMLTGDDFLKVEKSGYFNGSRRFKATDPQTQFLRITLLPQSEIGNFNNAQSAIISIDSRSKLTFPDHAVVRADGSSYNGNVHVMANPIYGDDQQLPEKMPGALTGLDQSGTKVVLGSLGMLAVELQADNGEILQLASGKTVETQFAIPDQQLDNAPSTIPLWYFDESKGYWVQEGQATRNGNTYVAQLPHFSFWNWDIPYTLIGWETSFIYTDGAPVQNARICLTIKSIGDQRCAYTNANGVVAGPVPANELLELNVVNDCGTTVFSQDVGPFTDNIKMDPVTLTALGGPNSANISGTALHCDGTPLAAGFVKVNTGVNDFIFPIQDAQGHYEGRYVYCAGDVVTLQIYDIENGLVSLPHVLSFDRDLDAGSIEACEQADQYLRYKITGFSQEYIYYLLNVDQVAHTTKISSVDSIGLKGRFGFTFDGVTTGQYKAYTLFGNQINIQNGQTAYVVNMNVNVTEYGAPGQYIKGDFSGKISAGGNGAGGQGDSDFSGTFAVKNE